MANNPERSGCLGFFLKLLGIGPGGKSGRGKNDHPYRLRANFLSAAKLAFHRVLEQAVGQSHSINNKVRLWDVLYVPRRDDSRTYEKFLDKALDAAGLSILHIKAAHTYSIAEDQQQIAGALPGTVTAHATTPPLPPLPPVQSSLMFTDPSSPKCHTAMVQRKAAKGKHAGKRFWACTIDFSEMHEQPNLEAGIADRDAVSFAATLLKHSRKLSLVSTADPMICINANPKFVTLLGRVLLLVSVQSLKYRAW